MALTEQQIEQMKAEALYVRTQAKGITRQMLAVNTLLMELMTILPILTVNFADEFLENGATPNPVYDPAMAEALSAISQLTTNGKKYIPAMVKVADYGDRLHP